LDQKRHAKGIGEERKGEGREGEGRSGKSFRFQKNWFDEAIFNMGGNAQGSERGGVSAGTLA